MDSLKALRAVVEYSSWMNLESSFHSFGEAT